MFLGKGYLVSKIHNHKDRVNNFVAFPGESIISSRDRLTSFVRSVPNQHIDDESLKEYLYRGKDDKNKAVLDTSAGLLCLVFFICSTHRDLVDVSPGNEILF